MLIRWTLFVAATTLFAAALSWGRNDVQPVLSPEQRLAASLPQDARWGLVVLDRQTGKELAAFGNAVAEPLIPASLVKLVTTGAMLEAVGRRELPKPFRFQQQLREMNVYSMNRVAERFFLSLGERRYGRPATPDKGRQAVAAFLAALDLPADEVKIADGSGLSRDNRATPRGLARYLWAVGKKPWFERFRATLPQAGVEGTVGDIGYRNRRFRVKSGRLDDVVALAGYGVDRTGRELAFAFIANSQGVKGDRRHSRGKVVQLLATGAFEVRKSR